MPLLRLTPATDDWDQPPSAEQSPVDLHRFHDVYDMSVAATARMTSFIKAATAHLAEAEASRSTMFVEEWKQLFEQFLDRYKQGGSEAGREDDERRSETQTGNSAAQASN
ncbi:hypothetical protein AA0113_g5898 [Alternaria arborescens]|jgi:hypothetical protein|uniref:Uncharacterized protein n=1 Tax=Alternaria arborescens TaxID=156630 RepID=A0A4Q4S5H8_9PLEO|nr:hypothetical protein AA0111_g2761 [Alternaria arborescens]RYN29023.1 hypothetical protein AA0112_g7332 [Alternaria arborescens]RYO36330.1 hypothetical protein AA0111_g2761 [Alternaria arborescens]RYO64736.1 hypothetical protein AA0113_g5898 [Alternaria arborescens]